MKTFALDTALRKSAYGQKPRNVCYLSPPCGYYKYCYFLILHYFLDIHKRGWMAMERYEYLATSGFLLLDTRNTKIISHHQKIHYDIKALGHLKHF